MSGPDLWFAENGKDDMTITQDSKVFCSFGKKTSFVFKYKALRRLKQRLKSRESKGKLKKEFLQTTKSGDRGPIDRFKIKWQVCFFFVICCTHTCWQTCSQPVSHWREVGKKWDLWGLKCENAIFKFIQMEIQGTGD